MGEKRNTLTHEKFCKAVEHFKSHAGRYEADKLSKKEVAEDLKKYVNYPVTENNVEKIMNYTGIRWSSRLVDHGCSVWNKEIEDRLSSLESLVGRLVAKVQL